MEHKVYRKVKAYIEKHQMLVPGDTVVAGVSGGADSVCLFCILCELAEEMGLRLIAVHVNHGIRAGDADADEDYVRRLCRERGVPFVAVREDVRAYAEKEHLSEEEAGRNVRYRVLEDVLARYMEDGGDGTRKDGFREGGLPQNSSGRGRGRIAMAHNANDRAETMLFHLFRGSGLTGAAGIRPVRGHIIRPVLCLKREEIEEYLGKRQISFCIDKTNMEDTYTRNRIRNHIFPFAEREICRGAVEHMCETADLLAETERYVREQAKEAYRRCVVNGENGKGRQNGANGIGGSEEREGECACGEGRKMPYVELDIGRLREEDPFICRQVLLLALEQVTEGRKDIASVHVKATEQLLGKAGSKQISLPYGMTARREARKGCSRLVLCREGGEDGRISIPLEVPIMGMLEVPELGRVEFTLLERGNLPPESEITGFFLGKSQFIPQKSCTKWFDYDRITKSLLFRVRETGDYLTINGNLSRKKLKDYMIDEKIPKNRREKIYVLADGSHILWVPGYRISEYYKVTENTRHILQVQLRGGL